MKTNKEHNITAEEKKILNEEDLQQAAGGLNVGDGRKDPKENFFPLFPGFPLIDNKGDNNINKK